MFDVITVGSATVDSFGETDKKFFKNGYYTFPAGAKILLHTLKFTTGGGGTNSAVALARLGLNVAFLGKVGIGGNSEFVLEDLVKDKIDASLVCRENARTGFSMIIDARGRDRTIFAYKGSNDDLKYSEVKKSKLKAKWFYFATMLEESFKTQEKLAAFAAKNNIKIMYNISSYLARKGPRYLRNILKYTDVLVLNFEEAQLMLGKLGLNELLKGLRKLGPKMVIITEGKAGVHAYDGKLRYFLKPHKVKVVETTGAGDAFASSFLAGMIKNNDVEFALKLAQVNAEAVITHHGAKTNLLSWNTAVHLINTRRDNIVKTRI